MRSLLSLALILFITGCARFPALDGTISPQDRNAPYPVLVPLDPLFSSTEEDRITPRSQADQAARIARLRSRAAVLRGSVLDQSSRQRMRRGIPSSDTR